MMSDILFGWCTIHVLIWFSLAVLAAIVLLYIHHVRWERRAWSQSESQPGYKAPSWVRRKESGRCRR